jgi:pimeloyl-ACP methyl ester carboxylesterase
MLELDPVGSTWGQGVRRAPMTTLWGWDSEAAAKVQIPTLLIVGAHDNRVAPDRVRELYEALGSRQKVLIDLGCTSHNAMWEKNHALLLSASVEWLRQGAVNGTKAGIVRMGY